MMDDAPATATSFLIRWTILPKRPYKLSILASDPKTQKGIIVS